MSMRKTAQGCRRSLWRRVVALLPLFILAMPQVSQAQGANVDSSNNYNFVYNYNSQGTFDVWSSAEVHFYYPLLYWNPPDRAVNVTLSAEMTFKIGKFRHWHGRVRHRRR
jgi:hypothetical protein